MFNLSAENMILFFLALGICIILIFIVVRRKEKFPYYPRNTLLTAAELKFYQVLKSVVTNQYDICCKVRLSDIITCTDYYWQKGYGPKISAKHIDLF